MHEMSIAASLLKMAEEEAHQHDCRRLVSVTVHYGQISGIMPDALQLAFTALIAGTPHLDARLELVEIPLLLKCPVCQRNFAAKNAQLAECPVCGLDFGHTVIQGDELLLARIEANPD